MYPFFHLETNSMTEACHYQFGHGKQSSIIYLHKAPLLLGLLWKYMSASFLCPKCKHELKYVGTLKIKFIAIRNIAKLKKKYI